MAFTTQRRVEFRDTDAAGIVHFSAFFPMMEAAEHEALRHLGLSVIQPDPQGGHLTWPRVSAKCDYVAAARFEDILSIEVSVSKLGTSSVTYEFVFKRDSQLIATGTITAVCCRWSVADGLQKRPISDEVRGKLQTLVA